MSLTITQNTVSRPGRYEDSHLEVDFARASASLDSHRMVLTRKEFELLSLLVQNAGEIIPRDALLWRIWGYRHTRLAPCTIACLLLGFFHCIGRRRFGLQHAKLRPKPRDTISMCQ